MSSSDRIARNAASELVVQTLPDGSMAIFEAATRNVYSLNQSAAAAWEACASPTTLPELAAAMSRQLDAPIGEDLAREAVRELAAVGLVTAPPTGASGRSRRDLLKQAAGVVAVPLVLVLTGAEQRAHAQGTGSPPTGTTTTTTTPPGTTSPPGTTTTSPPGTTTTTTAGLELPRRFLLWKFAATTPGQTSGRIPLADAQFNIVNDVTGQVVAQITTNSSGEGSAMLIPFIRYRIVETFAPPSLDAYTPFQPLVFEMPRKDGFGFDLNNVIKPA